MKIRFTAIFLAITAMSAAALGQTTFERKYEENSSYKSESITRVHQKLTILGMDTETNSDTTTVVRLSIGQRDGNGNLPVTEAVESVQVNLSSKPGGDYFFDSRNPDNKGTSPFEMLRDLHKLTTKTPATIVYDKNNQVVEVKFDQSALGALPVNLQDLVRADFDPEKRKQAAIQSLGQLPSEAVKPGDTWKRTEKASFGAGQVMTFETTYTYEGTEEKEGRRLEKITSKTESVKFDLEPNPALPLTLKSSDLKIAESTGTYYFDPALGRIVESRESTRITGDILFQGGGMDLPSKLDLKIDSEGKNIK